jgi:ESS family glutamate:Na+ symporter
MFDTAFFGYSGSTVLEVLTYHALALGFIASAFQGSSGKFSKERSTEIFNTGVTTVSTYLIQAIVGLIITISAAYIMKDFFAAAGILLPFGYGQGTGQALNYGNIFEMDYGFEGGKSFGLTVAAMGFLSAGLGGVIHLNTSKALKGRDASAPKGVAAEDKSSEKDIPIFENMDTLSVQIAFVTMAYLATFLVMYLLGCLVPGLKSVIFGFNFLLGVLMTTISKNVIHKLHQKNFLKKNYISDFLMVRIRNFFFDIMVVAGIAAIRLNALGKYLGLLLILGVAGAAVTYIYLRIVCKVLFKKYQEEQFLAMYGMLTGTASTGIILLREIDSEFKTPASDNLVYQNFPAIIFGFPMMILATLAPKMPIATLLIIVAFFVVKNIILFRSIIFKKFLAK